MKNKSFRSLAIATGVSLGAMLVLDLSLLAPAAEAGCRPTGRYTRSGLPLLRCTGATRCRPSGRYTRGPGGRRLPILLCPR
jgi:hypothetical protein